MGERHWSSMNSGGEGSSMNGVMGEAMVGERGVDGVDTVRDNSISSVKSVGGVSHDGGVSSEGLALGGGPVLSLVGLAHGLVAHLAVSVSVDWNIGAIVDRGNSGGDSSGQDRGVHCGVVGYRVDSMMERGSVNSMVSHRMDRGGVDGVMGDWVDSVVERGSVNAVGH